MNLLSILSRLFILTMLATSVYAQQQFTQTVTAQNKNCNATCSVIDIPELNGNPGAIVFIKPAGGSSNPHPIGAYYMYLNQWSVFNLDAAVITVGAKFNVEYYTNPDSNHFVYIVPSRPHLSDPAYIDHAGLNNNPNAQVRVFPHCSSTIGNLWNKLDVKVEYDSAASKWFIANVNSTPISPTVAYNIAVSSAITVTNPNIGRELGPNVATSIPQDCHCPIPTSLPPKGMAGGDLGGTYPAPKVIALQGKPVTDDQPKLGQVLKWSIAGWAAADEANPAAASSTATKPSVLYFNQSQQADMKTSNAKMVPMVGLTDQSFILAQSSRIVFHTAITAQDVHFDAVGNANGTVNAWLLVEILNASNDVVAKAIAYTRLASFQMQNMNSVGIGILTPGTYHTRVSLHRVGTDEIEAYSSSSQIQGGQMIIEIFPD